jgi:microcompartment protein CcmL/EutN
VPVTLVEVRLADDLGGRAVAILDGLLPDLEQALDTAVEHAGGRDQVLGRSLMARVDETLRLALGGGTRFAACATLEPAGAERLEEEPCSSAG